MTDTDDIVLGGGSAGCVVANRLSVDPARRVFLIEAGVDTPPDAVPHEISDSYPMPLFYGDRYQWPGLMVTTTRTEDGTPVRRAYEQGRVMGGGSSINVQLRLASPDADSDPDADFALLSDPRDLHRLAAGVRQLLGLVVHPALNPDPDDVFPAAFSPHIKRLSLVSPSNRRVAGMLGRMLDVPGPLRRLVLRHAMLGGTSLADLVADEAALHDFVRRSVFGVWHPVSTCRMGLDAMAVVDPAGRVIGCPNIWVADASVMPRLPTANTNIPTIMVAEKIAERLCI